MADDREWLFDMLWELSDKALEAELPLVAGKIEEAMDAYLAECHCVEVEAVFASARRKPVIAALPSPAQFEPSAIPAPDPVARNMQSGRDLAAARRNAQPVHRAPPWAKAGWGDFTVSQKTVRQRARARVVSG